MELQLPGFHHSCPTQTQLIYHRRKHPVPQIPPTRSRPAGNVNLPSDPTCQAPANGDANMENADTVLAGLEEPDQNDIVLIYTGRHMWSSIRPSEPGELSPPLVAYEELPFPKGDRAKLPPLYCPLAVHGTIQHQPRRGHCSWILSPSSSPLSCRPERRQDRQLINLVFSGSPLQRLFVGPALPKTAMVVEVLGVPASNAKNETARYIALRLQPFVNVHDVWAAFLGAPLAVLLPANTTLSTTVLAVFASTAATQQAQGESRGANNLNYGSHKLGKADIVLLQEMRVSSPHSLPQRNPFTSLHHPIRPTAHQTVLGKDTGILLRNTTWQIEDTDIHDYFASSAIVGADWNAVDSRVLDVFPSTSSAKQIPYGLLHQAGLVDAFRTLHPTTSGFTRDTKILNRIVSARRIDGISITSNLVPHLKSVTTRPSLSGHSIVSIRLGTSGSRIELGPGTWRLHAKLLAIYRFYTTLFTPKPRSTITEEAASILLGSVQRRIKSTTRHTIEATFTVEELKAVLARSPESSAPGLNGLTYPLFQATSDIFLQWLCALGNALLRDHHLSEAAAFRILGGAVSNRLQPAAAKAHAVKTNHIAGPLWILNLDQQKAYDRVRHEWLIDCLRPNVVLLYNFSLQPLLNYARNHHHAGTTLNWDLSSPFHVSSLAFSDDILLIVNNRNDLASFVDSLGLYQLASKAKVNAEKSQVFLFSQQHLSRNEPHGELSQTEPRNFVVHQMSTTSTTNATTT
ncbi:uncharacterized protein UHOD_12171 [Ustilago sp. UG-2017b]|nr:uncharacterized protein UHOD_12171 [Ustilago sp. UG-2017b]